MTFGLVALGSRRKARCLFTLSSSALLSVVPQEVRARSRPAVAVQAPEAARSAHDLAGDTAGRGDHADGLAGGARAGHPLLEGGRVEPVQQVPCSG